MRRWLDLAPLAALLGVWTLAGLLSALAVAEAEGSLRHVALGVVTLPSLVLIGRAAGRIWRGNVERRLDRTTRSPTTGARP
jgi:cytochrome b